MHIKSKTCRDRVADMYINGMDFILPTVMNCLLNCQRKETLNPGIWCVGDFQGGSTVQMSPVRGPTFVPEVYNLWLYCVDKTVNTEQCVCFAVVSVAVPLLGVS